METKEKCCGTTDKPEDMRAEQHGMPGTPALRKLFSDWLAKLEERAVQLMKKDGSIDAKALAAALSLDEESAAYLIARLARREDMEVRAKKACGC